MKYGILTQTRPASPPHDRGYAPKLWQELDDLYRGGYQILEHAERYLKQHVGEHMDRYRERLQLCGYIGYFGEIVDFYASSLFSHKLAVTPSKGSAQVDDAVYEEFFRNADLAGRPFAQVLKDAVTTAMVMKRGLIAVDFPVAAVDVRNRRDEERFGLGRPYIYELPLPMLINWEYRDQITRRVQIRGEDGVDLEVGRFEFAVLKVCSRRQPSPYQQRGAAVEEYKVWRRDDDGSVVWELYRVPELREGQTLSDDVEIPMVAAGVTSFQEIPIIEVTLPDGLWIGNTVGPLNKEHFQRRSGLASSQQKALFEIPWVKLGPEIGGVGMALPAERAQDPHRGDDPRAQFERRGYMVLGAQDDMGFAGPSGAVYTIVEAQLEKLVDEMHRVTHRMAASVSSTASAVGRSGASKELDRADTAIVLMAYGAVVRDVAVRIVDTISDARGEAVTEWIAHGLDHFEYGDRAALLEEGIQLAALQIPSRTARIELTTRTLLGLLANASPDVQQRIRDEVAEAVTAEESLRVPEVPEDEPGGPTA